MMDILGEFERWDTVFSFQEINQFLFIQSKREEIYESLRKKKEFLVLDSNDLLFISKKALFNWYIRLLKKLIHSKIDCLNLRQMTCQLNYLLINGSLRILPDKVVMFGENNLFLKRTCKEDFFFFPMVRVLKYLKDKDKAIAYELLDDLKDSRNINREDFNPPGYYIEETLANIDPRISEIIQRREGIINYKKETLEEIGSNYNLSRQRVRQIEMQFWLDSQADDRKAIVKYKHYRLNLMKGIIYGLLNYKINLWLFGKSNEAAFLCKCFNIPVYQIMGNSIRIIGISKKDIRPFLRLVNKDPFLSLGSIIDRVSKFSSPYLLKEEIENIYSLILKTQRNKVKKTRKVRFALEQIGKPAHFEDVYYIYQEMFADEEANPRNIHAALCRQEEGIVWIGIKGVYALKEWGYDRPSMSLFDMVTKIVREKYKLTKKPVSKNRIISEVGKYRKKIRASSLNMAITLNNSIVRIAKDQFIPKDN